MSPELLSLLDAIQIIRSTQKTLPDIFTFQWETLNNAENYLDSIVRAYFEPEAL